MKIRIASCYFIYNYGSLLQAFALQQYLENQGYEVENISIEGIKRELDKIKIKYYIKEAKDISVVLNKAGRVVQAVRRKIDKGYNKCLMQRHLKMDMFVKEKIYLTKKFNSKEEMAEYVKDSYAVVLGSDQLWLPSNVVADYYTLSFVPDEVNKIAFATSFGVSSIPKQMNQQYKDFLERFQSLSVRESTGQRIISDIANRECALVCDPTMLLSKKEWENAFPVDEIIKEPYIFCYFLGTIKEHRVIAKELKKRTGLKLVGLLHSEQYVKCDAGYTDYAPFNIGPEEFVNLIRGAQFILTDSFHGTVFSILNNKQFITFTRHSDNEKLSTNSRIYNLLNIFNLEDRMWTNESDYWELVNKKIKYDDIEKKLESFRNQSKTFLEEALSKK